MVVSIITLLALAVAVIAKNIPITVGDKGLKFTPNSTTAEVGDMYVYFSMGQTLHLRCLGFSLELLFTIVLS